MFGYSGKRDLGYALAHINFDSSPSITATVVGAGY